jgi:Mg2+ and Co2+ transporter CorA
MNLIDKDFNSIIHHWGALKSKVDRHLDVLLQFRVLEQQELAIDQRNMATKQQNMAVEEAKKSGIQARSILVFTALTIVFVSLSFFTSYFGMDLSFARVNSRVF